MNRKSAVCIVVRIPALIVVLRTPASWPPPFSLQSLDHGAHAAIWNHALEGFIHPALLRQSVLHQSPFAVFRILICESDSRYFPDISAAARSRILAIRFASSGSHPCLL